jgi:hypothetical protein
MTGRQIVAEKFVESLKNGTTGTNKFEKPTYGEYKQIVAETKAYSEAQKKPTIEQGFDKGYQFLRESIKGGTGLALANTYTIASLGGLPVKTLPWTIGRGGVQDWQRTTPVYLTTPSLKEQRAFMYKQGYEFAEAPLMFGDIAYGNVKGVIKGNPISQTFRYSTGLIGDLVGEIKSEKPGFKFIGSSLKKTTGEIYSDPDVQLSLLTGGVIASQFVPGLGTAVNLYFAVEGGKMVGKGVGEITSGNVGKGLGEVGVGATMILPALRPRELRPEVVRRTNKVKVSEAGKVPTPESKLYLQGKVKQEFNVLGEPIITQGSKARVVQTVQKPGSHAEVIRTWQSDLMKLQKSSIGKAVSKVLDIPEVKFTYKPKPMYSGVYASDVGGYNKALRNLKWYGIKEPVARAMLRQNKPVYETYLITADGRIESNIGKGKTTALFTGTEYKIPIAKEYSFTNLGGKKITFKVGGAKLKQPLLNILNEKPGSVLEGIKQNAKAKSFVEISGEVPIVKGKTTKPDLRAYSPEAEALKKGFDYKEFKGQKFYVNKEGQAIPAEYINKYLILNERKTSSISSVGWNIKEPELGIRIEKVGVGKKGGIGVIEYGKFDENAPILQTEMKAMQFTISSKKIGSRNAKLTILKSEQFATQPFEKIEFKRYAEKPTVDIITGKKVYGEKTTAQISKPFEAEPLAFLEGKQKPEGYIITGKTKITEPRVGLPNVESKANALKGVKRLEIDTGVSRKTIQIRERIEPPIKIKPYRTLKEEPKMSEPKQPKSKIDKNWDKDVKPTSGSYSNIFNENIKPSSQEMSFVEPPSYTGGNILQNLNKQGALPTPTISIMQRGIIKSTSLNYPMQLYPKVYNVQQPKNIMLPSTELNIRQEPQLRPLLEIIQEPQLQPTLHPVLQPKLQMKPELQPQLRPILKPELRPELQPQLRPQLKPRLQPNLIMERRLKEKLLIEPPKVSFGRQERKTSRLSPLVKLEIRKGGKFQEVGVFGKGKAKRKGAEILSKTLRASFRITPTGKFTTERGMNFEPSSKIFRTKLLKGGEIFIQRTAQEGGLSTGRLASRGERSAIQLSKRGVVQ